MFEALDASTKVVVAVLSGPIAAWVIQRLSRTENPALRVAALDTREGELWERAQAELERLRRENAELRRQQRSP